MRLVARACERLERSVRVPSLEALARGAGAPPRAPGARVPGRAPAKFRTLFVDAVGVTPAAFARARREARVRDELGRGASVTRALHGAGFGSSGRFYEGPGRSLGMAPSIYRRGAPGERIEFALGASTLGVVLVAATRRGVCAVELGARPQPLLRSLHRRFHRATIVRGGSAMRSLVRRVLAAVESPETTIGSNAGAAPGSAVGRVIGASSDAARSAAAPGLPLDLRGTAFQLRVWQALRCIRPGETRSYGEIARGVGAPRAGRAVAAACAANPVAVVIPCHRVIGADGTLAGYRWGLSRKRALLSRECRAPSPCA